MDRFPEDFMFHLNDKETDLLFSQKPGGPMLKLLRLSDDAFGVEGVPEARFKFIRDTEGKITEMKIRNPAGEWELARRSN